MGIIVRALSASIGLASEAIHHSREKKEANSSSLPVSEESQPEDYGSSDEAAWEIDDMAERLNPPTYTDADPRTGSLSLETAAADIPQPGDSEEVKASKEKKLIRELVCMAGPVPVPPKRLQYPVILPQRRPGSKERGFVRAYAPDLADCGIQQDVFLRFLKDWQAASRAAKWIDVVAIAGGIVGFVPSPSAQITSIVVQVTAGVAREVQERQRTGSFLDQANRELFMPRGLFAVVMTFRERGATRLSAANGIARMTQALFFREKVPLDSEQRAILQAEAAAVAAQDRNKNSDGSFRERTSSFKRNMAISSGKTYSELELPQSAELVYPGLDSVAAHDLETVTATEGEHNEQEKAGIKQKWKSAGKFVTDYMDRRAQADYEFNHKGSVLAVPADSRKAFASRYSDPSHPANSGSLVALLTGGAVVPNIRGRRNRRDRRASPQEESSSSVSTSRRQQRPRPVLMARKMQKDVLYLLVVNLPTDEEVEALEAAPSEWAVMENS